MKGRAVGCFHRCVSNRRNLSPELLRNVTAGAHHFAMLPVQEKGGLGVVKYQRTLPLHFGVAAAAVSPGKLALVRTVGLMTRLALRVQPQMTVSQATGS